MYFALMKIQAYRRIENIAIVNLHVVFPQNYTLQNSDIHHKHTIKEYKEIGSSD